MLTPVQRVKVAFLTECAKLGLTEQEMHALVRYGLQKQASATGMLLGKGLGALTSGAGMLGGLAVGLPIAAGGALGYGAAKAQQDPDVDVEEAKQDELEDEYRRLADEATANARRKRLASMTGKSVTQLRGPRLMLS